MGAHRELDVLSRLERLLVFNLRNSEVDMTIQEIPVTNLDSKKFIEEQASIIRKAVSNNPAINALSGGVILLL